MSSLSTSTTNYQFWGVPMLLMAEEQSSRPPEIMIDTDPDRSELALAALLPAYKGQIARIEFVHAFDFRDHEIARGVRMYDRKGTSAIHVTNALIGYDGSGPILTKHILTLLGIPDEVFEQINNSARHRNQRYAVALDIIE